MTAQKLPQQTKIEELESLRGMAALLVVIFHLPKWNPILDIGIINNGYLMVDLFFVLSGFVIFTAYSNRIETKTELIRFQFLRFGRLYPVHLVFLFAYFALEVAKYVAVHKLGTQDIRVTPFGENSFGALIEQLFLLQAIGPTGNVVTYNYPAWSISVEFYTYLIFGLSILFFRKLTILLFFVVALIAILMLQTQSTYGFTELLSCLAGFFIGCITASFVKDSKINLPNYLSLIIFIFIILFLQLKSSTDFDLAIYFLTSALIISLVLSRGGWFRKVLKHKTLTWLGLVSYSVYMSHAIILWAVNNVFSRVLKRPEIQGAQGRRILSLTTSESLIAIFAVLIVVLVVSQITYLLIEKPMREKSRRFALNKLASPHGNH
jgi:peptidoglycan/LPS O-acetylase OafA/YrhL